jgi:hypothetical protein
MARNALFFMGLFVPKACLVDGQKEAFVSDDS